MTEPAPPLPVDLPTAPSRPTGADASRDAEPSSPALHEGGTGEETGSAPALPIARVLPMLGLAHLDREFDYRVPEALDEQAQPGVRVRVRFSGRLVDGFLVDRRAESDHPGRLGPLTKVVSPEQVLTPEIAELTEAVAKRWAGTRSDVLRLAIPPRHARVEAETPADPVAPTPIDIAETFGEGSPWGRYRHARNFVDAVAAGRRPRGVWQALPGEDWCSRFVDQALAAAAAGGVLVLVPDQHDLDRMVAAFAERTDPASVVALAAGLGPTQRYRRWLSILRGTARVVVGTRSAVFAPVHDLTLIAMWDDGDESWVEPRAPYPHAREVALLRSHQEGTAVLLGGYARTVEAQALVASGWAHDLVADRAVVRSVMPRIVAPGDSDRALERDPIAGATRLPAIFFEAARAAIRDGQSVLVQVPRRGYLPAVVCGVCRTPARCRACHGPLRLDSGDPHAPAVCRWCSRAELRFRCPSCGSNRLRAAVIGSDRTAEELGRAFPGVPVRHVTGDDRTVELTDEPSLVVATPGAEPEAPGGYGAAALLDGWAMLNRADLRAGEQALARWMAAAALVRHEGTVVVGADASIPTVQYLIRWDPVGAATAEWEQRRELRFPPAVHLAAVDGSEAAISTLLEAAELPASVELLGPVPLPPGERLPASGDDDGQPAARMLVRVPRSDGTELAGRLAAGRARLGARKVTPTLRIGIDPHRIG